LNSWSDLLFGFVRNRRQGLRQAETLKSDVDGVILSVKSEPTAARPGQDIPCYTGPWPPAINCRTRQPLYYKSLTPAPARRKAPITIFMFEWRLPSAQDPFEVQALEKAL
jgi:hypothetical protein